MKSYAVSHITNANYKYFPDNKTMNWFEKLREFFIWLIIHVILLYLEWYNSRFDYLLYHKCHSSLIAQIDYSFWNICLTIHAVLLNLSIVITNSIIDLIANKYEIRPHQWPSNLHQNISEIKQTNQQRKNDHHPIGSSCYLSTFDTVIWIVIVLVLWVSIRFD